VLEIGIGNGMLSSYLKGRGYAVTTLDIREELSPDIVASVLEMPLEDGAFDVVACFEVLEHLEYDCFGQALREIGRVCARKAVVSLPDQRGAVRALLKLPFVKEKRLMIPYPRLHLPALEAYHKWEISRKGYPLRRIVSDMESAGFTLERTYRVFKNPVHKFFILRKA